MRPPLWIELAVVLLLCGMLSSCASTSDRQDPGTASTPAPEVPDTPTSPHTAAAVDALEQSDDPQESVSADKDADPVLHQMFANALEHVRGLARYRFQTSVLFADEEDGEFAAGSIEMRGAIAGSDKMHLVWANLEEDDHIEMIRIEDEAWLKSHGAWEPVPVMMAEALSQGILIYAPWITWDLLLSAPDMAAVYVGVDTIDGVRAHHYRSSHHVLDGYWEGTILDAEEDIWIAKEGYPVRYAFAASGIDETGDTFSLRWISTLTDVGTDIVILPPE